MSDLDQIHAALRGPVFSIVTPFTDDDEIDWPAIESYLALALDSGARAFYVMAYNSRFSQLSLQEIEQLNQFVTRRVKSSDESAIVIVADPIHCSTKESIEFCRHAESIGADLISLIFRERYYSDIQVATHFQLCAESTDVGLLIHEMPFVNGRGGAPMNWPIGLLDRLADIPNVVAIKEDCKEDAYSREVIETVRDRLNIIISGGGKRQWLRFADLGCQAWLNGIGVFEPKLATLFWRSYLAGDDTTMQKIITDIEEPFFEHAVGPFGWHLAIKSALECRGLMSRRERMPMMALDDVSHGQVERLMSKLPIDGLGL